MTIGGMTAWSAKRNILCVNLTDTTITVAKHTYSYTKYTINTNTYVYECSQLNP